MSECSDRSKAHLIGQIPHIGAAGLITADPFNFITPNFITAHLRGLRIGSHVMHQLTILKGARIVHAAHLVQDLKTLIRAQEVIHHRKSVLIHVVDNIATKIFISAFAVETKTNKQTAKLVKIIPC